MRSPTARSRSLDDVNRPLARRLMAQLHEAATWDRRFDLFDALIAERVGAAHQAPAGVAWAWRALDQSAGSLAIRRLTSELGWSRKHLIAQFRQRIGLPPKLLARILRFNGVVRTLEHADRVHWAALASDCGYYDQAHFIRDFRAFSGTTPSDFLARRLPDSASRVRD